jgi:signal transduction histidine kinase
MNSSKRITILLVEDDEAVRQTLADMLEVHGFGVVAATNGLEGLAVAKREAPSLIITDVQMQGMTGFELIAALRVDEALHSIPVIVISAKVDRATTRRGMELGAADFITKPFSEDELIQSVATRLEKKELVDELDAFAHSVAHDLKNPLCALSGRIGLAAMLLGTKSEEVVRDQLTEAAKAVARINSIIDELLILAGVRRQAIVPLPLDMTAIVREAVTDLEALLQQHPARVQQPDRWPVTLGHAPWIVQVWANFISNAAKYGGPDPQITLGGEIRPGGLTARFWVQDNGPGLSEADQTKMFVPFTRISTVRAKGHGLGLSIVRRMIEKLGGQVGVVSAPGAGARFWFELPAAPPGSPPANPGASSPLPTS